MGNSRTVLMVLGLVEFVRSALVLSLLPLFGELTAGYGMGVVGTAISLHYLADNILRLPAGWLTDRYGGKQLLSAGLVVAASGVFLVLVGRSAQTFVLGSVLFGLGVAPVWPAVISRMVAGMPISRTSEALSRVFIAWLVGAGLGPVTVNLMVEHSYRNAFGLLLALLGTAFIASLTIRPPSVADVDKRTADSVALVKLLREAASLKLLYPGMFIQTMSVGLLMPVMAIYARESLGLGPGSFNILLIGGGAFTVLLLVPAGRLADKLGVKWPLIGGFLLAAACLIVLPLQRSVVDAVVVGAFLGASYSFILPAWNGLMAKSISAERRGTMWAIIMTVEGMGTATGAFICGRVCDAFGRGAPFYTSAIILIMAAAFYAFGRLDVLEKSTQTDETEYLKVVI